MVYFVWFYRWRCDKGGREGRHQRAPCDGSEGDGTHGSKGAWAGGIWQHNSGAVKRARAMVWWRGHKRGPQSTPPLCHSHRYQVPEACCPACYSKRPGGWVAAPRARYVQKWHTQTSKKKERMHACMASWAAQPCSSAAPHLKRQVGWEGGERAAVADNVGGEAPGGQAKHAGAGREGRPTLHHACRQAGCGQGGRGGGEPGGVGGSPPYDGPARRGASTGGDVLRSTDTGGPTHKPWAAV